MCSKALRLFIFFQVCAVWPAMAQNLTKSPYSIFGVGDLHFSGTAKQYALGQVSQPLRGQFEINTLNPASYSGLKQTVFEAGGLYGFGTISAGNGKSNVDNFSFAYFKLAFPVSEKLRWGLAFGLEPYSNVGFNASSNVNYGTFSATVTQQGSGGFNRFYGGTGIAVHKYVSLGMNISYLFGQITTTKQLIIPEEYMRYNIQEDRRTIVKDIQLQYAAQYHQQWGKYMVTGGATFTQETSLNARQEFFAKSMGIGGTLGTRDTIAYDESNNGSVVLPASIALGGGIELKDKWFAAAEVSYTNWENFRSFGVSDSLKSMTGISIGASWIPNHVDFKRYYNRVEYRAGARYDNGNLSIYGKDIASYGITAGMGLPLGKTRSKLHITFEYYTKGVNSDKLIREDYFRFVFGVSFSDKWFTRYKYD